mgnify:CR=1 FL=1
MTDKLRQQVEMVPLLLGQLDDERRCQLLRRELNRLIESLYDPNTEVGWRPSRRADPFSGEAINWGDLTVIDVELHGARFIVYIEELDPNSHTFGSWIEGWARAWGWDDVMVVMEW